MLRANQDLREEAKKSNVFLWQIAEKYGINDINFTKKMRRELPQSEKTKILNIISELREPIDN